MQTENNNIGLGNTCEQAKINLLLAHMENLLGVIEMHKSGELYEQPKARLNCDWVEESARRAMQQVRDSKVEGGTQ